MLFGFRVEDVVDPSDAHGSSLREKNLSPLRKFGEHDGAACDMGRN
jgi:hypothetical protein